jgi:aminoglycoside/choline kinase family phosphotransferase
VLRRHPQQEETLYLAATDVLIDLYRWAAKADYSLFLPYDNILLIRESALLAEWFLPTVIERALVAEYAEEYTKIWQALLAELPALRAVLTLRDYHADNLIWLPERKGAKRVGLLDFQDAVVGSPAYDMVSFLEDARRDVETSTVIHVLQYYLEHTHLPAEDFMAAYALLGAQRNCKIIGIFTRLAVRDGKHQYLSCLPRVWRHLERDLSHPLLKPLQDWMEKRIPVQARGIIDVGSPGSRATA